INNTNFIGRELTSTAYATNFNLSGTVGNQDDVAASNYKLSYSVNGGPWQSTISTQPIPPTDTLSNLFGTTSSLNVGVNTVKMAVENVAIPDTISENDTLSAVFLKVLNAPLDLTQDWVEDFESLASAQVLNHWVGFGKESRWDFSSFPEKGRLSTHIGPSITIGGNRSISLDAIEDV